MTPQLELSRFSGTWLLVPIVEKVTEEGCRVTTVQVLNRMGEKVEQVTLREGQQGSAAG
jgi:hypothetical protein